MFKTYGLPVIALAALGFAVIHVVKAQQTPPKLDPPAAPARSPYGKGVAAAGIVEPNTEVVSLGSHLSGVVKEVCVKVGDRVGEGAPLFRLDDRAARAEWHARRAALRSAKAQLIKLEMMPRPEELPALEARVSEARANLNDREDVLRRLRRLSGARAASDEERSRAEFAVRMAAEQMRKAEADLRLMRAGAWRPDVAMAEAAVDHARAQWDQAETEWERLTVEAPMAGQVLQVNVRQGEAVSAQGGKALVVLGNTDPLHVRADIDEHDIPRFSESAPARAMLRGDTRREFKLTFVRVEPFVVPKKSLTGDNTERVDTRVLQVIYRVDVGAFGSPPVDPGAGRLFVGQQVDVYIERP